MALTSNTEKPSSTMALTSNTEKPSTMALTSNTEKPSSTLSLTSNTEKPSTMALPSSMAPEYLEQRTRKRINIEKTQDKSLIHGFQLQPYLSDILQSNQTLQETIKILVETREPSIQNVLKSLAHDYPNAFAFRLVKLLEILPPSPIRSETVSILLSIFKESNSLNSIILLELKKPLLNSLMTESNESFLTPLGELIGLFASGLFRYRIDGWVELHQYILFCFSTTLKLSHLKALIVLTEIPIELVQNTDFWLNNGNFDALCSGIIKFYNSEDKKWQVLTFKACLKVIKISCYLEKTEICNSFLPILLCLINRQHGLKEEKDLLHMVNGLLDLARLRIENVLNRNVSDLIWFMFGVAEKANASNELMCTSVTVIEELDVVYQEEIKGVIQKLFQEKEKVKRMMYVAMSMMSCLVEDTVWYDIDNKDCEDAGLTQIFKRGNFLFNLLSSHGDEGIFVPIVMEMLEKTYVVHTDWNVRYAAMFTIAAIIEKHFQGDMIRYIDKAVTLVRKSLNDETPQVLWVAMRAMICLTEYRELLTFCTYHQKFLDVLIPMLKISNCPRVQVYAIIAIRVLVRNCGLEKILSYGEEVLVLLLTFLKNKMQKLKEEALEALKLIADLIPAGTFFQKYYDTTMEVLTTVLFDNCIASNLFLRDKCLEFMSTIAMNFGQVDVLVKSLVSIEVNLRDTDLTPRYDILKAVEQFCRSPKVNIDNFIDEIMPMVLKCAQASMPIDLRLDDYLVENLRFQVCSILSNCVVRSAKKITPNIDKVITIFLRYIECSRFETCKACISAVPNLLRIKKSALERNNMIDATDQIMTSMIKAIMKETDTEIHEQIFRVLPTCIQISGTYFGLELIIDFTDAMSQILKNIMQNEITREATGTFEVGSGILPTEEAIKQAGFLIAKTIESFRRTKIQLLAHVDKLMDSVALFLSSNMPDRVMAFALSIFNILVPSSQETFLRYHGNYIKTACAALEKDYSHSRLHATRAIGICGKYGKHKFNKDCATESIKRLGSVISGDTEDLHDTAVSAFGRICFYSPNSIKDEVVIKWVSLLPSKHNLVEARYAHSLLARVIKRRDPELVGSRSVNVPIIMSVVKKILDGPGQLIDENDKCELKSFADSVASRMK